MSEAIITIKLPLKATKRRGKLFGWGGWLVGLTGGGIQELGSSRVNETRNLTLFGWHVLTLKRNQYHDDSDKERADRYWREWHRCETELRKFKMAMLGEGMDEEVKKLIRDSLGVDFSGDRS